MKAEMKIDDLTPEQRLLWQRVEELWAAAARKDAAMVEAAIHPRYAGWETGSPSPHDRSFAVEAALADQIQRWGLQPLSIEVHDRKVGVVHYTYAALIGNREADARQVEGRWTEVYLNEAGTWVLVAVSGGPTHVEGGVGGWSEQ